MIDLEKEYLDFIKNTVKSVLNDYELYIFGSRVKGKAKKYSDIDIAIKSNELNDITKSKIIFLFENSTIPYKVDIVDLNNITDTFRNLIIKELIKIN